VASRVPIDGMRLLFVFSLMCYACAGQTLAIGIAGGGRPTDDVTSAATPESRRYMVGPMIELGLPIGFAVEVDALYHRNGYSVGNGNFGGYVIESERANSWEFPILLKYKLPLFKVQPFVEAGLAPRSISGTIAESGVSIDIPTGQQTPFSSSSKTKWSSGFGVVTGGGVQFSVGRLRLSPEVRYTHWTSTPINGSFSDGASYHSTQEQVDVMLGVGWRVR
jgi:opacity protein-like surface antigen